MVPDTLLDDYLNEPVDQDERDDAYWSAGCDEYHRREEDRLIEESEG